jgi:hypothetical protein
MTALLRVRLLVVEAAVPLVVDAAVAAVVVLAAKVIIPTPMKEEKMAVLLSTGSWMPV